MKKQLTIFDFTDYSPSPAQLGAEIHEVKEQINNVRRGLFKRYAEMEDELTAIREELRAMRGEFDHAS